MGVLREVDEPNPKRQRAVDENPWSKYLRVGQRRLADNLQQVQTIPGLHLSQQRVQDLALPLNRGIYTYLWTQGGDSKTVAETYKSWIRTITDKSEGLWGGGMTADLDRLREGYVSGLSTVDAVLARLLNDPEAVRLIHRPLPPGAPPFKIEPLERGAAGAGNGAGSGAGPPNPGVATGALQSAPGAGGAGERGGERGTAVAAAQVRANAVGLGHPGHPVNGGSPGPGRAEGSVEAAELGPHVGRDRERRPHQPKPRSASPSPPILTAGPGVRPQGPPAAAAASPGGGRLGGPKGPVGKSSRDQVSPDAYQAPSEQHRVGLQLGPPPLGVGAGPGIHTNPLATGFGAVASLGRLEPPGPSVQLQAPGLPPSPAQPQLPPPPPPPPVQGSGFRVHVLEARFLPPLPGARALSSDPAVKASGPPPLDQMGPTRSRSTEWNPYGPADPPPTAPPAEAQMIRRQAAPQSPQPLAPPASDSPTLPESPLRHDRGTRRNPPTQTPVTPAEHKPISMSAPEPGEIVQEAVLPPADAHYRTRIEALHQLIGSMRHVSSVGGLGLSDIKRTAQKRQRDLEPILDRHAEYESDVKAVEQRKAELQERTERWAELASALASLDREAEQERASGAARHAEAMAALRARARESEQRLFKIMAEENVKEEEFD